MAKGDDTGRGSTSKTWTRRGGAIAITPTYLPEGQTYTMGLHDIVRVVQLIEMHGHMAAFLRAAKAQHVGGIFDATAVNFVKDFMVKQKMHADPIGKHIVNAREAQPETTAASKSRFNCNFG
jgi:hypothetical protein